MKRIIAMMLSVAMLSSVNTNAVDTVGTVSANREKPADTMTKAEFAEFAKFAAANMPVKINSTTQIDKAELLRDYYFDGFTDDEILSLEENGIYLYNYQTDAEYMQERNLMTTAVGTPSMTFVERPAVSYDVNTTEWTLVAGGKWNDISWVPFLPKDIGGYEFVGYFFENSNIDTLSSSTKPRVQEVIASLLSVTADPNRQDREVVNRNLNVTDLGGVGSYMQDYSLLGGHYVGQNYAIVVVYDSRFENVTGDVLSYYVHTDEEIELDKVEFQPVTAGNKVAFIPTPSYATAKKGFEQKSSPLEL